jgi:hypothetical protein
VVVLAERHVDADFGERPGVVDFRKETPTVPEDAGFDELDLGYI